MSRAAAAAAAFRRLLCTDSVDTSSGVTGIDGDQRVWMPAGHLVRRDGYAEACEMNTLVAWQARRRQRRMHSGCISRGLMELEEGTGACT